MARPWLLVFIGAERRKALLIIIAILGLSLAVFIAQRELNEMPTEQTRANPIASQIISGGPGKDGIPSIDEPKFLSVEEAKNFLADTEPGVAVALRGINRFYPYQILVWHEIVNDTVGGQRILVTYCPLCLTGFVFDPVVNGVRVEFGTSGKLYKSNLVMYDRATDSLWPQILAEAVSGPASGQQLKLLPSDQIRFGDWRSAFPTGEVLSRETGAERFYGSNPYGDYFAAPDFALKLAKFKDERLPRDAFILGLVQSGQSKAYPVEAVKQQGELRDRFAGDEYILRHDTELDVVRVFRERPGGTEERINPFSAFWFAWVATHPETELIK